jgi:hypothetical protein
MISAHKINKIPPGRNLQNLVNLIIPNATLFPTEDKEIITIKAPKECKKATWENCGETGETNTKPEENTGVPDGKTEGANEIAELYEESLEEYMVFIKSVNKDVGVYKDSISNLTFGPEPIHKESFTKVQLFMEGKGLKSCIYIIYSSEDELFHYQCILLFDKVYLTWLKNQ